jgi:hypothetical protein
MIPQTERDCRGCLHKVCPERSQCNETMKSCMVSETYAGCEIKKCRLCAVRMNCDMITWIKLGGVVR